MVSFVTTNCLTHFSYQFSHPVCCTTTTRGAEYRGYSNMTMSGRVCQRWEDNTPYVPSPKMQDESRYLWDDGRAGAQNYCRNYDDTDGPWCYTMDPNKRWERCDIPKCFP